MRAMRPLFKLVIAFAMTVALYACVKQPVPARSQLSVVEGLLGDVVIVPAHRRSPEHAQLQVLMSRHEHRIVQTLDMELARSVAANRPVKIKVYKAHPLFFPGTEVWELEQDGMVLRSYEQTLAVRGAEIDERNRADRVFLTCGFLYLVASAAFRHYRSRS